MKKLMSLLITTTIITLLISGCSKNAKTPNVQNDSVQKNIKNDSIKDEIVKEKTTLEMLQGKWQSTDDSNYTIIINGNNIDDGGESIFFRISDAPIQESDLKSIKDLDKGEYISYGNNEAYYIVELTTDKLSISEVSGRGNTLNYKRVDKTTKTSNLTEYDKEILGTWSGTLSGSNLAKKKLVLVFTKSSFNQQKNFGTVEGYSTVNGTNKTNFAGTFYCDADTPVLELNEPKSSGTNGTFKISNLSCEGEEISHDNICGTWSSYNGQLQREVKLTKTK